MRALNAWGRFACIGLLVALSAIGADRPPLVDAAWSNDIGALQKLLEQGRRVDETAGDGATALLWAAYHDDLRAAELLIRAGADVNHANDLGVTPLWLAGQNGNVDMLRRLLEAGADPNLRLLQGEAPLMVAARSGSSEVVEQLLNRGAEVNATAARGQTALMWAAAQAHPDVVRVLLEHGADVEARSDSWSQMMAVPPHGYPDYNRMIPHGGNTALTFAAREGSLASAKLLVAAGADVDHKNAWGVSAVAFAAHSGYRELLEFLLEQGADPNISKAGFSALHEAIMRRDERMARRLLEHGADPNALLETWTPTRRSSRDYHFPPAAVGASPFWLAARLTEPGLLRLLAEYGADPSFVHRADYYGGEGWTHRVEPTTALMAAVGMGAAVRAWFQSESADKESSVLDCVKLIVELGVELDAASVDGRTARDAAKASGFETVAAFLEQRGAR